MGFRLSGIIPPLVTPLNEDGSLDCDSIDRLIEHVLTGGVHGLFVLGTTGEGPSLEYGLRKDLIRRTCRMVNDRVPVLVGITDSAFSRSVEIARFAADAGAAALVLAPPPYFSTGQSEFLGYLERMTTHLQLPVFLYNMPSHTKVMIESATVVRAASISGIVGLKDSSSDMIYFHEVRRLLRDNTDFSHLVGPEELLAESVLLGGDGGVSGGANLCPELYVQLYDAARRGDLPEVRQLHDRVMDISQSVYTVGNDGSSFIRGLKTALEFRGICQAHPAEPFRRFDEPERQVIQERMQRLGLL